MAKRRGGGGRGGCVFDLLDLVVIAAVAGFVLWKWGPARLRESVATRARTVIGQLRERAPGGGSKQPSPPPTIPTPAAPPEPPAERTPEPPVADTPREDEPRPDVPGPGEFRMTREEYGAEWPLTVDEADVSCREDAVYLRANGVLYAVDGIALKHRTKTGAKDLRASGLWAADPSLDGFKKSLGPMIDKGLSLCR
jgi:hypothetical protein